MGRPTAMYCVVIALFYLRQQLQMANGPAVPRIPLSVLARMRQQQKTQELSGLKEQSFISLSHHRPISSWPGMGCVGLALGPSLRASILNV